MYTGLLDIYQTDDEMAAVLEHEVCTHIIRQLLYILFSYFCNTLRLSHHAIRLHEILNVYVGHVVGRHSSGVLYCEDEILDKIPLLLLLVMAVGRRYELQAGQIGLMVLAAAGVDPIIVVIVEQKASAKQTQDSGILQRLIATHPSSQKRCSLLDLYN